MADGKWEGPSQLMNSIGDLDSKGGLGLVLKAPTIVNRNPSNGSNKNSHDSKTSLITSKSSTFSAHRLNVNGNMNKVKNENTTTSNSQSSSKVVSKNKVVVEVEAEATSSDDSDEDDEVTRRKAVERLAGAPSTKRISVWNVEKKVL